MRKNKLFSDTWPLVYLYSAPVFLSIYRKAAKVDGGGQDMLRGRDTALNGE